MSIEFQALARELLASQAYRAWLPDGKQRGHWWVARNPMRADKNPGSFKVNMNDGGWLDFADDSAKGGDLVSLYAYLQGCGQADAARRLGAGESLASLPPPLPIKEKKARAPAVPIPEGATSSFRTKYEVDEKWYAPTGRWTYHDADGNPLVIACRYDFDNGKKDIIPWRWAGDKMRQGSWPDPRPLFNLPMLTERPSLPVVVTEGEKKAVALQYVLGEDFVVTTWQGGCTAPGRSDWSPIAGREVILWPDNDAPGFAAMHTLSGLLRARGCQCITIVPPHGKEQGWDAADATPVECDDLVRTAHQDLKSRIQAEAAEAARRAEVLPAIEAGTVVVTDPHDLLPFEGGWRHVKNGQPIATIPNLRLLLRHYRIHPRVNDIEKVVQYHCGEGAAYSSAVSGADITSLCRVNNMPVSDLRDAIARIAIEDRFNPVAHWLSGVEWDGVDRLHALSDSLGISDDDTFSRLLLRRWLCTAVAVAVETIPPNAQGMLVLQGPQGLGKSRWIAALTGGRWFREGLTLDVMNKDSVWQAITAWIVELGELDATFRKTEVAQLKSFLTRAADEFRRPYEAETYTLPRRTIFAATVNPDTFLHDPTGSRRFWVIKCKRINPAHGLDMRQVWAQALALYRAGEPTYLTPDENKTLADRNENHTESTAEQDLLHAKYDFRKPKTGPKMSAAEVAVTLGYDRPSTATSRIVGQALRKALGDPLRIRGRTVWQMPMPRTEADRATEAADTPPEEGIPF